MGHVWGKDGVYEELCCGNLMETDHLEVLGLYERIILKAIFKN
jgi:hypothetical protein